MHLIVPFLAGTVTGIISAFGVGGGTLLMLWLTFAAGMEQLQAQGVNLLYFFPVSGASLPLHLKNGYLEKDAILPAALCGAVFAALGALLAVGIDGTLLKRIFGGYLTAVGIYELLRKSPKEK